MDLAGIEAKLYINGQQLAVEGIIAQFEEEKIILQSAEEIPPSLGEKAENMKGVLFFNVSGRNAFIPCKVGEVAPSGILLIPEGRIRSERRAFPRFQVSSISDSWISESRLLRKSAVDCKVIDLSLGGARLKTTVPMEKNRTYMLNTSFVVKFKVLKISTFFKIRNSAKEDGSFFYGIEFVRMKQDDEKRLENYINRHPSQKASNP